MGTQTPFEEPASSGLPTPARSGQSMAEQSFSRGLPEFGVTNVYFLPYKCFLG